MTRNYRSRQDIISVILQASVKGTTKTRIMYNALLSYAQLKVYLALVIGKGLMTVDEAGKYGVTEKGFEFLRGYETLQRILDLQTVQYPKITVPIW